MYDRYIEWGVINRNRAQEAVLLTRTMDLLGILLAQEPKGVRGVSGGGQAGESLYTDGAAGCPRLFGTKESTKDTLQLLR